MAFLLLPRPWLPILAAILVASGAAGALVQRNDVTTTPVSKDPPVTLAAGTSGTTTLGASGTSAATTATMPVVGAVSALKIHKVSGDWDVSLALVSATGFSSLESVTVSLVGGTTRTQVVVALGSATQTSGIPVTLSGADVTVSATGTAGVTGVLVLQVRMVPSGQSAPTMAYAYTLTFA